MTNITCPFVPSFGYFDTPNFLKLALHILTATSTPVYILGIYCIVFKTPKAMKSVKWYMFTLHIWILLFDYSISLLCVPFLLVPAPAGISYGVLRYLGVPTSVQTIMTTILLNYMFISIIAIYENRFFIVCEFRGKDQWAIARKLWLFLHYFAIVAFFIPAFFLIPDQDTASQIVQQILPCLPDFIYQEPIFVLALDYTYHMSITIPIVVIFLSELTVFVSLLIRDGSKQKKNMKMSAKTYQMHRQFFIAIVLQSTLPLGQIGFPVIYLLGSIMLGNRNQAAINVCVIIATTHGLVSTVVMIVVHRPYRLAVLGMIRSPVEEKSTIVSVMSTK